MGHTPTNPRSNTPSPVFALSQPRGGGTFFTLFVVPAVYLLVAKQHVAAARESVPEEPEGEPELVGA